MNIVFTKHFLEKWQERKEAFIKAEITLDKVKKYILFPDFVLPDDIFENREWHIKKINKKCLKIVIEKQKDTIKVITIYFDRNLKRKGLCE